MTTYDAQNTRFFTTLTGRPSPTDPLTLQKR